MDDFSVTREQSGHVTVVSVTGRIDSVTAATLDEELAKVAHENSRLVLDLQEVSYLSSAGVRALLRVMQTAQKAGGDARLARLPEIVAEVLRTAGVLEKMHIHSSVDEALAKF